MGKLVATFYVNSLSQNIFMDFAGSKICDVKINGETLKHNPFVEGKIKLEGLKLGINTVEMGFLNQYSQRSDTYEVGLHSHSKSDGRQFVGTKWAADYAHHFIPCFD
jgi:hypothetical protein